MLWRFPKLGAECLKERLELIALMEGRLEQNVGRLELWLESLNLGGKLYLMEHVGLMMGGGLWWMGLTHPDEYWELELIS